MCLKLFPLLILLPLIFLELPTVVESNRKLIDLVQHKNGYYYYSLWTDNYPHEFKTPYFRRYAIDTKNLTGLKRPQINIYLTELHVNRNYIRFITSGRNISPKDLGMDHRVLSTKQTTLEIHVNITDLYNNHFRSPEHFLQNFGFNITIEVVEEELGSSDSSCSIRKCLFAGICRSLPGLNRLEFRCDCMPDYEGLECQHGPKCDSRKNISFCSNGGKCRVYGQTGEGFCDCPDGFEGPTCRLGPLEINFVSENNKADCLSSSSNSEGNDRPCSLCNRYDTPQGFHRFLITGSKYAKKESFIGTLNTAFKENYYIHSNTTITTKISRGNYISTTVLEVYGHFLLNETSINLIEDGISIKPSDSVNRSTSNFNMSPRIYVNELLPLKEDKGFILTCKCRVDPKSNYLIRFKWFKDNIPIQRSYTTRHISQFQSIENNGTEMWAFVMVDSTSGFDNGVFSCQVTDFVRNVQECVNEHLEVMLRPQIEVVPMSVTVVKNESVVLTCTVHASLKAKYKKMLELDWYKEGELIRLKYDRSFITEHIYSQGQLLRVLNAQESMTFECRARNKAGETRRSVRVQVLESRMDPYDSCNDTWEDQIEFRKAWGLTGIGQTAMSNCPPGFMGYAQKRCLRGDDGQGVWARSDFSRCIHDDLAKINFTLQSNRNGFNVEEDGVSVMPARLDDYLNTRRKNRTTLLFGEGDKFISMLIDTFDYFDVLRAKNHVTKDDTLGMIAVLDHFISFGYSCVHESTVLNLVGQFEKFVYKQEIHSFESKNIFIHTFNLGTTNKKSNTSLLEIKSKNVQLKFEFLPIEEVEGINMTFIKLSNIQNLNEDENLISDIISVNISEAYYFKNNSSFEIEFMKNTTQKNLTCAGLNISNWVYSSCTINVFPSTIKCVCNRLGVFAVLALKEVHELQPVSAEQISSPPNWIATSGCIVCLVLCLRTLTNALMNKIYCPYFLVTTIGLIISICCLLYLILIFESRAVGIIYLTTTLCIKSVRIWRMSCMYDMKDIYSWLGKWVLLAGIILSLILPLYTVFVFDSIYTNDEFILDQASPVFITFGLLVGLAVLAIIIVYYKTVLRIRRKESYNNNNQDDHIALNENILHSMIHLIQVLTFVLYWNLKQTIIYHPVFAVLTGFLGLTWRSPRCSRPKAQQVHKNKPPEECGSRTVSNATMSTMLNNSIHGNVHGPMEMRAILKSGRIPSSFGDDEENDHETNETSVSTISTKYGKDSEYRGSYPVKGTSYIYDDYVMPSLPNSNFSRK